MYMYIYVDMYNTTRGEAVQFTHIDAYKINTNKMNENIVYDNKIEIEVNENDVKENETKTIGVKKSLLQRAKDKKIQRSLEKNSNFDFTDIASASMDAYKNSISEISPGPGSTLVSVSVLCRTPEQVKAACQLSYLKEITLDFLEVHGLRYVFV
jgi:hypothetical protein